MKFSEKMTILKLTKEQCFTPYLEESFLEIIQGDQTNRIIHW